MPRTVQMFAGLLLATAVAFCPDLAVADVRLPSLVSDGMVLQRDMKVRIWGWAGPGERVSVTLRRSIVRTTAGRDGSWSVMLDPHSAGGPHELHIHGKNEIVLRDILFGDVWFASGQSNMEWSLKSDGKEGGVLNAERELADAIFPQIRLFAVKRSSKPEPMSDVLSEGWRAVTPDSVSRFSAVAYFFGRDLHQRYRIPIGLIEAAWGGTPAEAWVSKPALANFPEFAASVSSLKEQMSPDFGVSNPAPTTLFNGMINPVVPYAIKGAIWYQGESNAQRGRALQYRALFPALIADWRVQWGYEFPFLYVQLAGYGNNNPQPAEYPWAELREAQSMTLSVPNTGMASAIDIGDKQDIHPRNKQEVSRRLARIASKTVYGEDVVSSGPTFDSMQASGNTIRIKYRDVGAGLRVDDRYGYIRGFQISGEDGLYVWANARIEGKDVLVSSERVAEPRHVRYAWENTPDGNLYNKEGFPAVPFRTNSPQSTQVTRATRVSPLFVPIP